MAPTEEISHRPVTRSQTKSKRTKARTNQGDTSPENEIVLHSSSDEEGVDHPNVGDQVDLVKPCIVKKANNVKKEQAKNHARKDTETVNVERLPRQEPQKESNVANYLIILCAMVAMVAYYLMQGTADSPRKHPTNQASSIVTRRKQMRTFEKHLTKDLMKLPQFEASIGKSFENDLYSPLEALSEFGEQVLESSWNQLDDKPEYVASLQLVGDDQDLLSTVIKILTESFEKSNKSLKVMRYDAGAHQSGDLLPSIAKFLESSDRAVPHLILVTNSHDEKAEVMQLKDNLERPSLLLNEKTGSTFPTSGVGIIITGASMTTDSCREVTFEMHDEQELHWHRSFVSRIGLKARICI